MNITVSNKTITSSKSTTTKQTVNYAGSYNTEIYESTLPTVNTATTMDKQTIKEAVRVAKDKYGKAFEKLAEE